MNDKIKENLLDQSCAPTDNLQSNWDRIDWTKAEQAVKKLQARIVKAQKEGRHNKVKALQWTLTHSFYAKALAVKRVTSNGGGCTPGVDKEIWDTPKAKTQAITQLKRRGYQPMPLRRVHIKKSNGKLRPLGIPTMKEIYENARLFIRVVGKEGTDTEAFYYDSSYDSTTHWRRGNRPRFSPYTSSYEADDTGAIYLPSLKRALQGTPWQYCALRQFYEPTKEAMQVSTYLRVYRRHPKLIEHLVKVGFERIVSDIVYRHGMGAEIDATQKRTHRILRVNKEDLAMLRELNAGVDTLKAYQQYVKLNLRGRQELLQWQLKNHVHTIPTQWFAYMTARKFMRYMDSQLPDYMQLKRAFLYRSPMEEAISTYSDYLQMCQGQNYDMKSSQVLFPKHCNEAHDELSRYIKKCRDEQTKRAFREVYENLAEKANLTSKKLQIVCPKQTDDLITEGQALHHCVGTYIERVAAKKCLIVFVRRVEEPEKPFVTVEVSNGKIVQIRGERNSDPTKEVKKFVDLWSRKVLPMALQTA